MHLAALDLNAKVKRGPPLHRWVKLSHLPGDVGLVDGGREKAVHLGHLGSPRGRSQWGRGREIEAATPHF